MNYPLVTFSVCAGVYVCEHCNLVSSAALTAPLCQSWVSFCVAFLGASLLSHSFSLFTLILTLWETRLLLKESLYMFEQGKAREREGKGNVTVRQTASERERRILAACVKPGQDPVPQFHRALCCLP